jgi:GDP-L-fucose synthase
MAQGPHRTMSDISFDLGPADKAPGSAQSEYRYDLRGTRVFVAGHRGMVGSALVRRLESEDCEVVTVARSDLDLRNSGEVTAFFRSVRPQAVFMSAAKVGGILANLTYPADFLYDNLMIAANVTKSAAAFGTERMVFLGSSCIYPKYAAQPIAESALLTGALEPTNEAYAVAKIAGLKLVESYRRQFGCDFVSAMPSNLYGPGDNYDLQSSHVIPALIRKAHEAKTSGAASLVIWGSGRPRRQFLHVDDCADALVRIMTRYSDVEHINVGVDGDISIDDLATLVSEVVGFEGGIEHDLSKPDGTPQKLMDCSRLDALGWRARIGLKDGLRNAYRDFLAFHGAG